MEQVLKIDSLKVAVNVSDKLRVVNSKGGYSTEILECGFSENSLTIITSYGQGQLVSMLGVATAIDGGPTRVIGKVNRSFRNSSKSDILSAILKKWIEEVFHG